MDSLDIIAACVSAVIILWSAFHAAFALYFRFAFARRQSSITESCETDDPKVSVILSLRGHDPFLEQTLECLLNQSYGDFEIIVVVDSDTDPAWAIVQSAKLRHDRLDRMRIYALQNPRPTCSLKCSALVQAIDYLSDDREVVVLIDADVVPHQHWLSDVASPLSNQEIGVVTGNQWFEPAQVTIGSTMRSLWNAGALVVTAIHANPWAGTCAMRRSDLIDSGLIDAWKTSVVDDGPIKQAFQKLGKRVQFEPSLIMVNRDGCDVAFVNRYITRMLTWSRVYESSFIGTAMHAIAAALIASSVLAVLVASLIDADPVAMSISIAALTASNLIMFAAYTVVRQTVARAVLERGCTLTDEESQQSWPLICLLIPLVQMAHVFWTLRAVFVRSVKWRQITYRLEGRGRVKMLQYVPLSTENPDPLQQNLSV